MPDDRFIVITGASRGLGRAMTDGFISAGQTVAGCARSKEAIADLERQVGPPHRFDIVDVSGSTEEKVWMKSHSNRQSEFSFVEAYHAAFTRLLSCDGFKADRHGDDSEAIDHSPRC